MNLLIHHMGEAELRTEIKEFKRAIEDDGDCTLSGVHNYWEMRKALEAIVNLKSFLKSGCWKVWRIAGILWLVGAVFQLLGRRSELALVYITTGCVCMTISEVLKAKL